MTTDSNNDLQAAIERERAAGVDKPKVDPIASAISSIHGDNQQQGMVQKPQPDPRHPDRQFIATAAKAVAAATVITPASIRNDNNAKLNAIADERKALTGEIGGIDEQMNRLLDQRNAAIARMGEIAQAEAMIRAAQTVGNAPRWTQG